MPVAPIHDGAQPAALLQDRPPGSALIGHPDRYCWPASPAMNTQEIDTFLARVAWFTARGLSQDQGEAAADKLVPRDREGEDRRLCLECAHLHGARPWWCGNAEQAEVPKAGLAPDLVLTLQRCPGFRPASL